MNYPSSSRNVIAVGELMTSLIFSDWSIKLKVNDRFLGTLYKAPKSFDSNNSNAYWFGYNGKDDWIDMGEHGNDVASTGIMLMNGIVDNEEKEIIKATNDNRDYLGKKYKYLYPHQLVLDARKLISERILFVGATIGGDVGASVLIHLDKNNEINGLIINNHYFN
jgi:hypothetical protein